MDQPHLFDLPSEAPVAAPELIGSGKPRLRLAERKQVVMRMLSLDQMLPHDDDARMVWEFVEQFDLSPLYEAIRAVEGHVGRPPADPRILLALWLFATLKGIGSARDLARQCERHLSYQWLCGDVSMNHHTLADFRVNYPEVIDDLLTRQVAAFIQSGAVQLERVAQDGVRVRASAGKASFRSCETLEACLAEAEARVQALKQELEDDPSAAHRREQAAKERAARERLERVQQALVACAEVQAMKDQRGGDSLKHKARGSTTDPDARNMKMADGGFRPAYNVQFATDTQAQVIVGVDAINQGTDAGQLAPMVEQIKERAGVRPKAMLADGGFTTNEDVQMLNQPEQGYQVYVPVKEAKQQIAKGQNPYAPRPRESAEMTEWRTRMGTPQAQQIYVERAATAECVNAIARQRGLTQFRVRGADKVKTNVVWFAVAHNMRRWAVLRAEFAIKFTTTYR